MSSSISRRSLLTASCALTLSTVVSSAGFAAQDDLAATIASRRLRVVVPSFNSQPFFSDQAGQVVGIDVELAQGLAAALELELDFDRRPQTFNDAVSILANGEADLAICKLSRTLSRARVIQYSQPYVKLNHGLIVNRVRFAAMAGIRPPESVIRGFNGQLGVIAKSSFVEFAKHNFPDAKLTQFDDWAHVLDAIRDGGIDAAYRDEFEIKKVLVDDPSLTIVARSVTLSDLTDTIGIGIAPERPRLAAFIDLYMALSNRAKPMTADEALAYYKSVQHKS